MLQITINEEGIPSFKFTKPVTPKEMANLFYCINKIDFAKSFSEVVTSNISDEINLQVTNYLVEKFEEDSEETNRTYLELFRTPISVNSKKNIR